MRWLTQVHIAFRSFLQPRREERELNEEMQYHLHREIHERLTAGMTEDEARQAALRAMGAMGKSTDECRDLRSGHGLASAAGRVRQDLRFAVRLFRRHPAPIAIALGGLALAIAVVTSVFSIVNATMLRPYGMDDPASVVSVARPGHHVWAGWPYAQFLRMRDATALIGVEAALEERAHVSAVRPNDVVPSRPILFVSGGYLSLLGGRPALGRSLGPSDDVPGAPPAIVVSHHFWTTELNADPSVVGRTVWVNDVPVILVGVLEAAFTGPVRTPQSIWAALSASNDIRNGTRVSATTGPNVGVIGRLAPGVSRQAAEHNLTALVSQPTEAGATTAGHSASQGARLYDAASPIDGPADVEAYVGLVSVAAIVGLILALACVNAANLLMASAVTRVREVGVRLAMGATTRRLIAQMLTESLLLGAIAGGLGFVLAFWLVPIFGAMVEVPPQIDLAPDGRALIVTTIVAFVSGLGAGLSPARYGARGNVLETLQAQSGSRGRGGMPSRFRASFVGFQAAVSMLLLVTAGLLARTAILTARVDIGFDADRLVGVSFDAPWSEFDEGAYVEAAIDAVRAIPSVERASVAQDQPFGPSVEYDRFTHNGRSFMLNVSRSDAELFSTTGVRILRGRAFTPDEVAREAPVALVSESVAKTFFSGRDPIGQSLAEVPADGDRRQDPAAIVGVVADAMLHRRDGQDFGAIYRPISRQRSNPPSLVVRAATPAATARAIETALRGIDPRVRPATRIVRERLDAYVESRWQLAWLLGPPAVLALLLAGLGVYGVTSFVVSQRTEEVSVRMALGASSTDVLHMLLKDGLRPVVVGLGVGLGLALVVGRLARWELAGIGPYDPVSIGAALAALLLCALIAVVVPARRAARTDPARLLRQS